MRQAERDILIDVVGRLREIDTTVSALHKHLLGNGQPGVVEGLNRRVTRLESLNWRMAGGLSVVIIVVNYYFRG